MVVETFVRNSLKMGLDYTLVMPTRCAKKEKEEECGGTACPVCGLCDCQGDSNPCCPTRCAKCGLDMTGRVSTKIGCCKIEVMR